ncbi:LysM peptidoglycan-binding domain-containing protein [Variovorax ureilyticus]|uniref:LysM peptidoglycan-binding domain-containing protein n=1 Tax=Variovorax ureilyticus TaxID=1836198 RepID=UPI003D6668C7
MDQTPYQTILVNRQSEPESVFGTSAIKRDNVKFSACYVCATADEAARQAPKGDAAKSDASIVQQEPADAYYVVKPKDTIYRIALEAGESYYDVMEWNNLAGGATDLSVGQKLRVKPPIGWVPNAEALQARRDARLEAERTSAQTNMQARGDGSDSGSALGTAVDSMTGMLGAMAQAQGAMRAGGRGQGSIAQPRPQRPQEDCSKFDSISQFGAKAACLSRNSQ